jgi:hypothetical protein
MLWVVLFCAQTFQSLLEVVPPFLVLLILTCLAPFSRIDRISHKRIRHLFCRNRPAILTTRYSRPDVLTSTPLESHSNNISPGGVKRGLRISICLHSDA